MGTRLDSGGEPVTENSPLPVAQQVSSTADVTSVASATTSGVIIAANTARKGVSVTNTDANVLYLLVGGGTASATNYSIAIAAAGHWECPYGFTGAITGIWAVDGAGAALVTEYS